MQNRFLKALANKEPKQASFKSNRLSGDTSTQLQRDGSHSVAPPPRRSNLDAASGALPTSGASAGGRSSQCALCSAPVDR